MGLPLIARPTDFFPDCWDLAGVAATFRRLISLRPERDRLSDKIRVLAAKMEARQHSETDEGSKFLSIASGATADPRLEEFKRSVIPELDAAYNFARFLSRDADAAQDIVQNAFLRAFRAFDRYRGGDLRAWMLTIVRNCHYDWLSERRRKAGLEVAASSRLEDDDNDSDGIETAPSPEDTPEAALLRKSEGEMVRLVLTALPRPLREVLVLREIEGFSYREIAEIASVPIGTVMSRLARARKEFSEAWRNQAREDRS